MYEQLVRESAAYEQLAHASAVYERVVPVRVPVRQEALQKQHWRPHAKQGSVRDHCPQAHPHRSHVFAYWCASNSP